jgi:CspA family cold shock protein
MTYTNGQAHPDSSEGASQTKVETFEIQGHIKWFDVSKGYGFIAPSNGQKDVLLHVTVLCAAGYQTAYAGSGITALAIVGKRGLQAFQVLTMDESTATPPTQLPQKTHVSVVAESGWVRATVKWFNRVRGFGFLMTGENDPDVFVHMDTLRRFGIIELREDQEVFIRWGNTAKGRMVAEIRPAK